MKKCRLYDGYSLLILTARGYCYKFVVRLSGNAISYLIEERVFPNTVMPQMSAHFDPVIIFSFLFSSSSYCRRALNSAASFNETLFLQEYGLLPSVLSSVITAPRIIYLYSTPV